MKTLNTIKIGLLALALPLFFMASCKKDKNSSNSSASGQKGFFYAENGASTQIKADDAWVNGSYKTIMAKKGSATVLEINLSSIAVGTYSIASPNAVTYIPGGVWVASAGTVKITKNDGSKVSGNFDATTGSGVSGVNKVSGSFTDIPIK